MNRLPPRAAAVVEAARGEGRPAAEDRERVRAALIARLGAAAFEVPHAPAPGARSRPLVRGTAAKALGGAGITVGAGVLLYALLSGGPSEVAIPVESSSAAPHEVGRAAAPRVLVADMVLAAPNVSERGQAPAPPPSVARTESVTEQAPTRTAKGPAARAPAQASATKGAGSVAEELQILLRAQSALDASDPVAALSLLDEHARRFPNGALSEERASQRVVALCAAGRTAEARREGEAFLRDHPYSPGAARVRAACAGQ